MSFIKLKQLLPAAFADNEIETLIAEVNKAVGFTMPDLPPFEWAALAVEELEKRQAHD